MPLGRQVYLVVCWFCFVLFCFPICYQICPEKSFELLKNETEYTTIYFTEFGVQQLTYEIICSVKGMHPSCLKRGIRDRGYTGSVWEGVNFLHSSMYSVARTELVSNQYLGNSLAVVAQNQGLLSNMPQRQKVWGWAKCGEGPQTEYLAQTNEGDIPHHEMSCSSIKAPELLLKIMSLPGQLLCVLRNCFPRHG